MPDVLFFLILVPFYCGLGVLLWQQHKGHAVSVSAAGAGTAETEEEKAG